ncbi:SDR family oxidoreductase [Flavihumibacter rivuli]|uniref:SDR family oxidoreductase n=1 Tax=Flavihumibacter rivuli TaxID=2838156 RepID=UPI001BDE5F28|nr:SDR family oxidoreductase [Flavihumibacter rivuli]ULQ55756.1 SDR family oxidoreductase [Flavihumibacter rivuli]
MNKDFQGKVVLVTGGSYGIGQATAIAFASRGATVVIADKVEDPQQQTLRQVQEAGAKGRFVKCDVSSEEQVVQLIRLIVETYGRLDFAYNNAGIEGEMASTDQCTERNFDTTIAINLKGVFLCMKHELIQMHKQGSGVIVNCSSVAGLKGFANLPAYTASKHGVIGLTKSAAIENAKKAIRINAVCPGVIHTPMIERATGGDPEKLAAYVAMEPIGRMGEPKEIAESVCWLCSDAASFVTGVALPVDGGFLM